MIRQESDTGVSPVVGIILMVAVTVALVALAANFVFNIGGESSTSAAATVSYDDGADTAQLIKNENADVVKIDADGDGTFQSDEKMTSVGDTVTVTDSQEPAAVIAVVDGEEQVLQTLE